MSREWVINNYSGYEGLVLQDCKKQNAGAGEIRLKIEAFALNWGDMDLMLDRYSFSFRKFPARIGMEATGIVDQIGDGVKNIELGKRYCTLPYFYYNKGASADYVTIDSRYVTPAPENLTAVESASVWMQFMTAYYPIVELSKASPEKNILVTAGTSTAGNAALNIGKMFGANMITTTRFEKNRNYLLNSGANHVIVTNDELDIGKLLKDITKDTGIHSAFDCVGEGMISRYSLALARDAKIFFYGTLDGIFPQLPIVDMFQANATFHPYSLFNYVENTHLKKKGINFVYNELKKGSIIPNVDRVYSMEEYREAWDYLKNPRENHGKVVVKTGL